MPQAESATVVAAVAGTTGNRVKSLKPSQCGASAFQTLHLEVRNYLEETWKDLDQNARSEEYQLYKHQVDAL